MPGFDRTGPLGLGPRTGWGLGLCGPGRPWRGRGRGRWFGRFWGWGGFGRFWRFNPYWYPFDKKDEIEILENEASILEQDLRIIKERLATLKSEEGE